MDEALRKIERILAEQKQPSRIDNLLPRRQLPPKQEPAIDIAHYGKVTAGEQTIAPASPAVPPSTRPEPAYLDPAAKIGVGAREFKLDELSSEALGGELNAEVASKIGTGGRVFKLDDLGENAGGYDPLMGNVFKPSNTQEFNLDDLPTDTESK